MRKTIVCGAGVVALVVCLLAARGGAPAQATVGFAPADVSQLGENPQGLRFAGDARGAAVALWENNFAFSYWTLKLATRPAGGAWRAPLTLAHMSREQFGESAVAIAPHGGGVIAAIWQAGTRSSGVIRAVVGTPRGIAQRSPLRLSNVALEARSPQVAFDRRGDAVAVWEENNREIGYVVMAAVMPAGRHAWRVPTIISGQVQGDYESHVFGEGGARIALDSEGGAVVVWQASNSVYAVLGSPLKGGWRRPVRLSKAAPLTGGECTGGSCCRFCQLHGSPKVVLDGAGNAVVAWGAGTIQAAVRPVASRVWQAPVSISRTGSNPQVAADAKGDVTIVWAEELKSQTTIMASTGTAANGGWRRPIRIGQWPYRPPPLPPCRDGACKRVRPIRLVPSPQVALGADGEAVAVWESSSLETSSVNVAVKPADGDWRVSTVLATGGNPWIAINEKGQAMAAWVGPSPNPEETLGVACEPVVQTAVPVAGPQAAAKRTMPSSSCSSTR